MDGAKPLERGTAKEIEEVSLGVIPIPMFRFKNMAGFYSREPFGVRVKIGPDDDYQGYVQVFRLVVEDLPGNIDSWLVYSEEREWAWEPGSRRGLVVRNVYWDRQYDVSRAMGASRERNRELAVQWPAVSLTNVYAEGEEIDGLVDLLKKMDEAVGRGIRLTERADLSGADWSQFELYRLFDWGHVQSSWARTEQCSRVEELGFSIADHLESIVETASHSVHKMQLDHTCPVEVAKFLTTGEFNDVWISCSNCDGRSSGNQ